MAFNFEYTMSPPPPPYNGNVGQPPLSPLKGSSKLRGSVLQYWSCCSAKRSEKRNLFGSAGRLWEGIQEDCGPYSIQYSPPPYQPFTSIIPGIHMFSTPLFLLLSKFLFIFCTTYQLVLLALRMTQFLTFVSYNIFRIVFIPRPCCYWKHHIFRAGRAQVFNVATTRECSFCDTLKNEKCMTRAVKRQF